MQILHISLPRLVKRLHQIEITSRCSLRCVYCPSPNLQRPKMDMTRKHYERCLEWVSFFIRGGTQEALNLAGIGESTLHPDFVDFVRLAREVLGNDRQITFATNGVACDEEQVKAISPYRPEVWVSLHRPEEAGKAIHLYKKYGLLAGTSSDPSINANNWAGQVKWHNSTQFQISCEWLRHGRAMAMADGRLTACCLDASGKGVFGHIDDPIGTAKTSPWDACASCHHVIGINGYDQKKGTHVP